MQSTGNNNFKICKYKCEVAEGDADGLGRNGCKERKLQLKLEVEREL